MNTARDTGGYANVLRPDGKTFLIFKPRIKVDAYERTISFIKFVKRPPRVDMVVMRKDTAHWQCVYCRHIATHELMALGYRRDFSSDSCVQAVFRLKTPEVEETPKPKSRLPPCVMKWGSWLP